LHAVEVLREVNKDTTVLPKSAPTSFVRQRWAPYVMPGGVIDRHLYEFCVLSELRDRLRAGNVWGRQPAVSLLRRTLDFETDFAGHAERWLAAARGGSGLWKIH
jgi:hypothetical protein